LAKHPDLKSEQAHERKKKDKKKHKKDKKKHRDSPEEDLAGLTEEQIRAQLLEAEKEVRGTEE